MLSNPRVLVVASLDDALDPLCEGLDRLGWRTVTARDLDAALLVLADMSIDAAVVDVDQFDAQEIERLRRSADARYLTILGVGEPTRSGVNGCDLTLSKAPHPAQAALRLEQMTRAAVADEEFVLRQATFGQHGVTLAAPDVENVRLNILTVGAADRRFLALSNALTQLGAEVVAAPTPYTAFDYLHERAFDGAVLWGDRSHAPALAIAAGMRRNTRLYHIPLTLYLWDEETGPDLGDLYRRGFADVADPETSEGDAAARVMALARNHRRQRGLRRALDAVRGSDLMDETTGLFSRELFASHLNRLVGGARMRSRKLSVCVLRVADREAVAAARPGGWLEKAMPQVGAMVSRLVRVEDTAARLSSETFALALPATDEPSARITAERIAAVIACTAFDAGKDRSPFVVELDVGVAQLTAEDTALTLLERASAGLPRA
ncbi:diguanylate cyclase domain-containing protein [Brevundimonas diminuta]|uniref:diguanylate cyclase domain-containing protein n=1 Tax=Brevundimonas diminuta TaxID=293 RepID=UPI0025A5C594|nr:diguanylate cyclase [Brevundimonas diminuta]MDM8353404.1 diguanylate cyclase [Brevundimonas diminuta]